MKKPHDGTTTLVTTAAQRHIIEGLMRDHLDEGGGLFAQVFHDGIRIKVLTPSQAECMGTAIVEAMGTKPGDTLRYSAFEQGGAA